MFRSYSFLLVIPPTAIMISESCELLLAYCSLISLCHSAPPADLSLLHFTTGRIIIISMQTEHPSQPQYDFKRDTTSRNIQRQFPDQM